MMALQTQNVTVDSAFVVPTMSLMPPTATVSTVSVSVHT